MQTILALYSSYSAGALFGARKKNNNNKQFMVQTSKRRMAHVQS